VEFDADCKRRRFQNLENRRTSVHLNGKLVRRQSALQPRHAGNAVEYDSGSYRALIGGK
jgi:hypothetical protein